MAMGSTSQVVTDASHVGGEVLPSAVAMGILGKCLWRTSWSSVVHRWSSMIIIIIINH